MKKGGKKKGKVNIMMVFLVFISKLKQILV